jgi:hypothetical protein
VAPPGGTARRSADPGGGRDMKRRRREFERFRYEFPLDHVPTSLRAIPFSQLRDGDRERPPDRFGGDRRRRGLDRLEEEAEAWD